MSDVVVLDIVSRKALAAGAESWLAELPSLVAALEREWSMKVRRTCPGGTEAFVAEVSLDDQSPAVLKAR
jgi:streptomycin 6-kinase